MSSPKNLRRSSRIKASSRKKYTEDSDEDIYEEPSRSNIFKDEIEKQIENIEEDVQRPLELFSEKDVSGTKLYGFQTPMKRNSMMMKAKQCLTPETPKSFRTLPILKVVLENIQINSKKDEPSSKRVSRRQFLPNIDLSGNESISEDSEYLPNSEVSSESSDENSENSINSETSDAEEKENNGRKKITPNTLRKSISKHKVQNSPIITRSRHKTVTYKDYHMKTDEYFEFQSEKTVTSDHTLEKLRNTHLIENELSMKENYISIIHKKRICSLMENYKSFFPMWQFIMEEGYSLLLHGLGSKRKLINDFHNEIIAEHPALVVNGFFPSLSIKDILNNIIVDLLNLNCPTYLNDCIELIESVLKNNANDRLYLIIHNIDGMMLRSIKTQSVLASLAAIPNIHVIASIDHINSPLLWDHRKRAKFNFYWWDATTFLPYQAETAYESSLLVQQSSSLALSSLESVFLSLTPNARAIYLILVKYQLDHSSNNFTGMPFKTLYRAAREQFLVSSDLALRTQLTEFVDHKLVRTKRTIDGTEHVAIPLDKGLLKHFMEQHES